MSGPSQSNSSRLAGLTVRLRESRAWLSLLLFGGAIVVVVGFTLQGMNADRSTAQTDGLDDGQLDATLLSLGAVGVSDSANPSNGEVAASGPLDLTSPDFATESEPAPLFALDEASPAIMFEQAKVTTGPLFGAARSVPSASAAAAPTFTDRSGGVITADRRQSTGLAVPQFGSPIETTTGVPGAATNQTIRPVSGVRSAAWLTGTIE